MRSNGSGNGVEHNRRHWDAMFATDPKHTKPFDRGGFKGKAVDPVYRTEKMTEVFGPVGLGWGTTKPEFERVGDPLGKTQNVLVYCTIGVWVENKDNVVYGVGGDHVVRVFNNGRVAFDDEAYKKAYTDAITNALVKLGNSADVHLGLHDDNKYVAEMRKEFTEEPADENAPKQVPVDKAPKPPMPTRRAAKEMVKATEGQPAPAPTVGADALPDMVELRDRHGNTATYSVSGEPASIAAAIETDLVDSGAESLDELVAAWKRHYRVWKRLDAEPRSKLEALKDRLKAKHEGDQAPASNSPPADSYNMPDIPPHLDRRPNGGANHGR